MDYCNSRLQLILFTFMVTVFLQVFLITLPKTNTINTIRQTEPKNGNSTGEVNVSTSKARLNVIILTHMSSGSSIVGNTFNFHKDVFYVYEPLHTLRREVYNDPKLIDMSVLDNKTEDAYRIVFHKHFRDLFTCKFQDDKTIDYMFPRFLRTPNARFMLAWKTKEIQFTKNSLRNACNSRRITVLKIMQNRVPGKPGIRELQTLCNSGRNEFQCLIIHLIRDPRAVLSSLVGRTFFLPRAQARLVTLKNTSPEGKGIIMQGAHIICSTVEDNLNYVNAEWSNWFKNRYIVVRYEDTAGDLLRAVLRMYNFTGLPMTTTIRKWITQGGLFEGVTNRSPEFIISKEDVDRIEHWRSRLSTSLVSDFEEACYPLMYVMGYISVNDSDHTLHNTAKKLWTEKIPFPFPH